MTIGLNSCFRVSKPFRKDFKVRMPALLLIVSNGHQKKNLENCFGKKEENEIYFQFVTFFQPCVWVGDGGWGDFNKNHDFFDCFFLLFYTNFL